MRQNRVLLTNLNGSTKQITIKFARSLILRSLAKITFPPFQIKLTRPMPKKPRSESINNYVLWNVLSVDGTFLGQVGCCKVIWYLSKSLADVVSLEERKIQLKFAHKARKVINYFQKEITGCVVCGTTNDITQHHIFPYCFSRQVKIPKKWRGYDLVLLCQKCHRIYEEQANQLKEELAQKHKTGFLKNPILAKNLACSITNYKHKIPEKRLNAMKDKIANILGLEFTEELRKYLVEIPKYKFCYGYVIMNNYTSHQKLQEFVELWRNHFITTMKPKFMPEGWKINEPYLPTNAKQLVWSDWRLNLQ